MSRFHLCITVLPVLAAALVSAAAPASAQVASALLREGDSVPGADGFTVGSLSNTAVNHAGGYAVTLNAEDGTNTLSMVWGEAGGGAGMPLQIEAAIAGYIQTSFESFFGIADDGTASYSPSCTDTLTGTTGLDGVWLGDLPVAVEEGLYPNEAGQYWSFGSRPGVTADGAPYWVGGITDTQGGSTQRRGLFFGTDATKVLLVGDFVGGLPDPMTAISFDHRYSAFGSHYIAEIGTDTGSGLNDNSIVIDGSVALSFGEPLSEGSPIPVEAGGMEGENWDNFDFAGITESGTWMITGDTDGGSLTDEFIAIDGVIVHREGDVLDGEALSGSIEGAYLNEDGDYAFIWDVIDSTGTIEALYLMDRFLLAEGDPVDFDGDGNIDPDTRLDAFTGISALTLGDRRDGGLVDLYFTADVEVPLSLAGPIVAADRLASPATEENGQLGPDVEAVSLDRYDPARGVVILEGAFRMTVDLGASSADGTPAVGPNRLRVEPSVLAPGGGTTLEFENPSAGSVSLGLYSVDGRRRVQLAAGTLGAGLHRIDWDGRDTFGRALPAGVYLARFEHERGVDTARITLVR